MNEQKKQLEEQKMIIQEQELRIKCLEGGYNVVLTSIDAPLSDPLYTVRVIVCVQYIAVALQQ